MKHKLVKFLCLILVLVSCKNTEVAEISPNDEIKAAFNSQKEMTSVKRYRLFTPMAEQPGF